MYGMLVGGGVVMCVGGWGVSDDGVVYEHIYCFVIICYFVIMFSLFAMYRVTIIIIAIIIIITTTH